MTSSPDDADSVSLDLDVAHSGTVDVSTPGAGTAAATPSDPLALLNRALSEALDVVQDVKQARRKVSNTDVLHAELDRLFDDLRGWLGLLLEQDTAHGVSPLDALPTAAGRSPVNLWPGKPTDEDVRATLAEHLVRLGRDVGSAQEALAEDPSGSVLADIAGGIDRHVQLLRGQ